MYLLSLFEPVVVDSTIWQVNMHDLSVREMTLPEMVTDYCIEDFLYVLTPRMLYTLDSNDLSICDRIPLPQRFNYMTTTGTNIALIASDEIILINKRNLAYTSGIGIERGDNRPLRVPEHFRQSSHDVLYLISDSGSKSKLKMLNVQTGEVSRWLTLDKIVYYECDCLTQTVKILDASNKITTIDASLRKKESVATGVHAHWFTQRNSGYLLSNSHGLFSIDGKGRITDFLPASTTDVQSTDKLVVLNRQGVVICDPLTLRPQHFIRLSGQPVRLVRERTDETQYVIVVDALQTFSAIEPQTGHINILRKESERVPIAIQYMDRADADSLWYFQTGAFATGENARKSCETLRQIGLPVYIDTSELYRVKIGGFLHKEDAVHIIESTGLTGWFVFQKRVYRSERTQFRIGTTTYLFEDGTITRSTP
jgi:hypothetical protein